MSSNSDAFLRVRDFVVRHTGCQAAEVTPTTRLLHDLWIDGDDAVQFFDSFFEGFGVDPAGFRLKGHFDGEPPRWTMGGPLVGLALLPVLYLCRRFGWSTSWSRPSESDFAPIRVSDLVAAVESGRWPSAQDAG